MRTVMVMNAKGGSGKTTIVTSLAGYFASRGLVTALKDYDPQGSSTDWLKHRPKSRQPIYGVTPFRTSPGATRVWQMRIPTNTDRVLIDSPAGIQLLQYGEILRSVDNIIVPIVPSPIDIRATAFFLRDLFAFLKTHPNKAKVGVVANRVTRARSLAALQRIFANIDIPCIASFSENENFIAAAEHGVSLLELETLRGEQDRKEWEPLLRWLGEALDVTVRPHVKLAE